MANNKSKNKRSGNYYQPNFWGAFRDIMIAAMNKGQFPLACFFFLIFVMIVKMPGEDVTVIFRKFLDLLANWSVTGWVISGISIVGWFGTVKYQRRIHSREMTRVTNEKTDLQRRLTGRNLGSSNGASK